MIFFTADHGGHGRNHGSAEKSDMTVPLVIVGADFTPGPMEGTPGITDLAPTIAWLTGAKAAPEWEGKNLAADLRHLSD